MTNEEKALELRNEFNDDVAYKACIEMSKWKDQQFDSMIIYFYHLIRDGISFEKAYKQITGKEWQI